MCGGLPEKAGELICRVCEEGLPYIRGRACRKCGKQLAEQEETLCKGCRKHERSFLVNLCLLNYDGVTAEMMAGLKYHGKKEYADGIAWLLWRYLGTELRILAPEALVPVPVHRKRRKKRGYNQTEAICRSLSAFLSEDRAVLMAMGLSEEMLREVARINRLQRRRAEGEGRKGQFPVRTDLLLRVKNTEAQKKLSAPERLLNLQSAFRGTEAASGVETVLLLDDIYTTGATMEACTRALLAAGVRQVYGLCVCAGADV